MFSFPEGPQPTSVPVPELGERARLVIEVPHWTAAIAIIDKDLRPIADLSKIETLTDGRDGAFAIIDVTAGSYNIEVRLGGNTQALWVVALEGQETRVPMEMWDSLTLATSMPLASTIDGTPAEDPLVRDAERLSQTTKPMQPLAAAAASDARLFMFGRLGGSPPRSASSWDIQLIDETGEAAATLQDREPVIGDTFWSCAFDLPKGYYVLRAREIVQQDPVRQSSPRSGEKSFYRCQPLYLCAGWENHVFLDCDESPRLATMSFNMGRIGAGFRPDDDATIATASVLAALGNDDAGETIVGASKMEELLRGEMDNPWLGVLAAYALSSGETRGNSVWLLDEVKEFLLREMSDHPDVRALTLDDDRMVPLDYPPMLRAGLRMVRAFADESDASAIVTDSALSKVGRRFAADSAWTAWVEPDAMSAPEPLAKAVSTGVGPMEALAQVFSSSAAVYPLAGTDGASGRARSKSFAEQIAIIEQAEKVLKTSGSGAIQSVKVASGGSAESLLNTSAATILHFAGADEQTVQKGLEHLSLAVGDLEHLDHDSARAMQSVLAAIFDAKRCPTMVDDADSADPVPLFTPIEDHIATLRQEARRMRSLATINRSEEAAPAATRKQQPTTEEVADADALAIKLDDLAERLAGRAHLVIIADQDGQLLYGNKLLYDRLQQRADREDVLGRIHDALKSESANYFELPARELSPTSPEGREGSMVAIHRTLVRGEHNEMQAYIYLLRNAQAKHISPKAAKALDAMLPIMTIHAATAQYGESAAANSLAALEALTRELDSILG